MQNQRNLLLAILLSMFVIFGYDYFFAPPIQTLQESTKQAQTLDVQPVAPIEEAVKKDRSELLKSEPQLVIDSPMIEGSINLKGARFNNIVLKKYQQTIAEDSPNVVMFSPSGSHDPYFAAFNWVSNDPAAGGMPDKDAVWEANKPSLKAGESVTLSWRNFENVEFQQIIHLDEDYMFTIQQRVLNHSSHDLTLLPYGAITRQGTPETSGYAILHEGPIGVINGALKEYDYKDLQKKSLTEELSQGGWIGITDKYWLSSIIPDPSSPYTARFTYSNVNQTQTYQTDYRYEAMTVTAGQSIDVTNRLFVGPKLVNLLDHYEAEYNIDKFDHSIDFGWFYFLTKPFFYAINFIYGLIGNFGLSILAFTVIIKLILFPLANKSYTAMSRMKLLQPKIKELRETYKDDQMTMNKKLMELYKTEKVNPMGGCLPILIQIPIFFSLYKVLFVTIEARHAPFFGWIHDLSAPDPTTIFNLFGLIPFTPPTFLMIGAWPLIMGFTMYFQQKLNPTPQDPIQAKIFTALPIVFTFLLAKFPAGLVIYWAWNNSLSMLQQWTIMKKATKAAEVGK